MMSYMIKTIKQHWTYALSIPETFRYFMKQKWAFGYFEQIYAAVCMSSSFADRETREDGR